MLLANLHEASSYHAFLLFKGVFLGFGILFWIPVLDSPPLHPRLDELRRVAYVTAGATTGWLLAVVLAVAPTPLYPAYAALRDRWPAYWSSERSLWALSRHAEVSGALRDWRTFPVRMV